MNFSQQANRSINCYDFRKYARNDNYVRSSGYSPSAVPHPRDFHMDNIFASDCSFIYPSYHFPFDEIAKNHAFSDSTHYSITNPVLDDLHQHVMSNQKPLAKTTDVLPKALDIDLFLEEIFEAVDVKKLSQAAQNNIPRNDKTDAVGNFTQPSLPPVTRHHAVSVPATPEAATKKRVTKAYSPAQKIQYVDLFRKEHEDKGAPFSQRQFARTYHLSHARFSAWCKEYDKLKSLDASQLMVSRVRTPSGRYPVLESRVAEWIDEQRTVGHAEPTIKAIQTHARELATTLHISDFVASNSWVERFRRRCDHKPAPIRSSSKNITCTDDVKMKKVCGRRKIRIGEIGDRRKIINN